MTRFGAKCALLLLLSVTFAAAQTTSTPVSYSYNGYPVLIAPDYADLISVVPVVVPRALAVSKVTVKVEIEYPQVGDLNVYLYSPDGTRTRLLEHDCDSLRNVDTTFDDSAPSRYSEFCPVEAGRGPFRGNESLSNFNSVDSSLGVWRLAVENDRSDSRSGWIRGVTLEITGTPQVAPTFRPDTVLNTASARSGAIVPGENITILGIGLGPTDPATASGADLPTTLSGVRVTINGVDIPLTYVSSYRIDGQVPFTIAPTGPATVQIWNSERTSAAVSISTQATSPGIYTWDPEGIGQAKAGNQDGSTNTRETPVSAGQVVTIYASGLGAVEPPASTGQPGPSDPLSLVSQPVAASIGGVSAPVWFAGLAPGMNGVYQLNILVPTEVPAGTRDIVISNGGNTSQDEVTIEVQEATP